MHTTDLFNNIRILLSQHITCAGSDVIITFIIVVGIAVCATLGYYATKLLLAALERVVTYTDTGWDDDLINSKLIRAASQLTPALTVSWLLPRCFEAEGPLLTVIDALCSFYIIWTSIYIFNIFVSNLHDAMEIRERYRPYAIKGIFQMFKLIAIIIGVIVCISIIIGKSPVSILTALGASAAILMLVFKDTILGLVASVQLTANKMLHKGDWVVVSSHDANGEIEDVSLTTVKIRNWDNSITTVPPYALISESFRNYQPMRRDNGRRICRSIHIDVNTVRFLTADELQRLAADGWLEGVDTDTAGRVVNLGLLRRYLEHYLASHPDVRDDMLLMVRQLEPTTSGIPLELYFFTSITSWKPYEHLQSDIFDHVYAVLPQFGLSLFQTPAGRDLTALSDSTDMKKA